MGLASNKAVQKSEASGNPWLKRRSVCLSWDTCGGGTVSQHPCAEKVGSEVSFGASGADLPGQRMGSLSDRALACTPSCIQSC